MMERKPLADGYSYAAVKTDIIIQHTDGRWWQAHLAPDSCFEPAITPPERVPEGHEWTGEYRPAKAGEPAIEGEAGHESWDRVHEWYEDSEGSRYILRKLPEIPPPPDGKWQETHELAEKKKRLPKAGEYIISEIECPGEALLMVSGLYGEPRFILRPKAKQEPKPTVIRYKVLTAEGKSAYADQHGGITLTYFLPHDGQPGEWQYVPGDGCYVSPPGGHSAEISIFAGGKPRPGLILVEVECDDRLGDPSCVERYHRVRVIKIIPWHECPEENWKAYAQTNCPELFEEPKHPQGLDAWKQEFYPIPASEVAKEDAVAHSLRKWEGTRPAVLEKYGLTKDAATLCDDVGDFIFTNNTCALCVVHETKCDQCALFRHAKCSCLAEASSYKVWLKTGDPEPMILALQACMEQEKKGKGYPRYFMQAGLQRIAFCRFDSPTANRVFVHRDGREDQSCISHAEFFPEAAKRWTEITEAEALALLEPKPAFKAGDWVTPTEGGQRGRVGVISVKEGSVYTVVFDRGLAPYYYCAEFLASRQPQVGDRVWVDGFWASTGQPLPEKSVGFGEVMNIDKRGLIVRPEDTWRGHGACKYGGPLTFAPSSVRPASFAPKPTKDEPDADEELRESASEMAVGRGFIRHGDAAKMAVAFHKQQLAKAKAETA